MKRLWGVIRLVAVAAGGGLLGSSVDPATVQVVAGALKVASEYGQELIGMGAVAVGVVGQWFADRNKEGA